MKQDQVQAQIRKKLVQVVSQLYVDDKNVLTLTTLKC